MSTGKMNGNRAEYCEDVADGREDYYADTTGQGNEQPTPPAPEDARGRWLGKGADVLGLRGSLVRGELSRLVSDQHPRTGAQLAARKRMTPTQRRGPNEKLVSVAPVSGWDLTFSAPKSVSVLYAVGAPDVRDAVREAHDHAVSDALAFVERHATFTRRGAGGVDIVPGDGFIAAAFRHVTSRAGDPQLHSHVVISNLTRAAGRYTRLDARPLLATLKTGGFVYQAALREQLTERLGLHWGPVVNGHADVVGVSAAVMQAFSTRAGEIQDELERRGTSSAGAAQVAALATRAAKDYAISTPELRERWHATAAEHGLTEQTVPDALHRATTYTPDAAELQELADRMLGPHGLTSENASFTFRDVVRAWAQAHPAGASSERLEQLAEWTLRLPGIREIDRTPHAAVYSVQELLDLEAGLLEQATARAGEGTAVVAIETVDAVMATRPTIAGEQAAAVRALTTSGAGIEIVRGYAGAGKTFMLQAAREAWEEQGVRVTGAALAGKAAEGLQLGSGIPSSTLTRLLGDLREGHPLPAGGVLVIDEAAMVGTRDLHELATHARATRTKLVLVGDDAQLPELQAGGSFSALARRAHTAELVEVRRQRDPGDIQLLSQLRRGDAAAALEALQATGRLIASPDAERTRERLVADWVGDELELAGRGVIVVRSREEERDLNRRARARLQAQELLADDLLEVDGRAFAVGDRVICGRNRPTLAVSNGTTGTVTGSLDGSLTVHTDAGADVRLPPDYLHGRRPDGRGFVEHAYAITTARAQGATWQRSYVLAEEGSYREEAYTQLSRHTDQVRLYLTDASTPPPGHAPDELKPLGPAGDAATELARSMSRSRVKETATSTASAAAALRLADRPSLEAELASLNLMRPGAAERLRRAKVLDRQLHTSRSSLERLDERVSSGSASRTQRDVAEKLRARLEGLIRERGQLGDTTQDLRLVERCEAIGGELHRRTAIEVSARVRDAVEAPPPHLTSVLGVRPKQPDAQAAWDRGAQVIETYRQRFAPGLGDEYAGLGPEPGDAGGRRAWHAFHAQLGDVLSELQDGTREPHDNATRPALGGPRDDARAL